MRNNNFCVLKFYYHATSFAFVTKDEELVSSILLRGENFLSEKSFHSKYK